MTMCEMPCIPGVAFVIILDSYWLYVALDLIAKHSLTGLPIAKGKGRVVHREQT